MTNGYQDPLQTVLLGALAFLVLTTISIALARSARAAFVFWVATVALVPYWFQAESLPLAPATIAAVVVFPALLFNRNAEDRWLPGDTLILAIVVCGFSATFAFGTAMYPFITIILQWLTAYLVGRRLAAACGWDFVFTTIAFVGIFMACWSIAEYTTGWHVLHGTAGLNSRLGFWAELQERGGITRSEASFGHSIALGAFLALALPFAFALPNHRFRVPAALLILLGAMCTLSRSGILSAVTALILTLLFVRSEVVSTRARKAGFIAVILAALFVGPIIQSWFQNLSGEIETSTDFRSEIWNRLPYEIRIIGQSDIVDINAEGFRQYGEYRSVDAAPLLIGLDFGWIMLALLIAGLLVVAIRIFTGKGSLPDVALLAQLPTLITAALITQYGSMLWLMVGLVCAQSLARSPVCNDASILHRDRSCESSHKSQPAHLRQGPYPRERVVRHASPDTREE